MSTNFTQRFNLPAVLLIASLLPLTGVVAWALTQMTSDYNLSGTYLAPSMAAQAVPHYVLRLAIAICIMAFGLVALIPTAVLTLRCWWPVLIAMMPLAALIGSSVSTFTTEVIGANIGAGGSLIGLLGTVPAELIVVPYLVYSTVRGAALGKGWLPDPRQSDQLRYFDKRTWTDKTTTDPTVLLAWAGWYPDPWNASQQRIFNGTTWISDTRTTPPKYLPYRGTKT